MEKTGKIDSKEIYIYISSPGGSVMEGMKIVDLIKSLEKSGRQVSCISDFSASMAFIILQSCPKRLATFSSILMQHQMSLGLEGNIENVNTFQGHIVCDKNSKSELCIPFEMNGINYVLDVDSNVRNAFCEIDEKFLAEIIKKI